ncbi:unnamed protein product, partial [Didymodactylos carnosus]
ILNALPVALQDEESKENQRYASRLLHDFIRTQNTQTTVQTRMLLSFEELARNQQYEIPQNILDRIEEFLSTISKD